MRFRIFPAKPAHDSLVRFWHDWYAWYPVPVSFGQLAWLEVVSRRYDAYWYYRLKENQSREDNGD